VSKEYYRPAEVETLLGDSSFARKDLEWIPKISFEALVEEMMVSDLALFRDGEIPNPF